MILGKLILSNFSAYAGTQTIDLSPAQRIKPIILVGGLNGAGKTSLLTAVRLALYGKRIATLGNGQSNYSNFLKELVHDKRKKEVAVDLSFVTFSLGEEQQYKIRRSWVFVDNGKAKETFTAWKNGQQDKVLSDTWDEFIDALMPVSISHLFFFDGEKVAEYANGEGTAALLQTGIQSLLGVDLLTKLKDDLGDLVYRKAKARKNNELVLKLDAVQSELGKLLGEKATLKQRRAGLVNRRERLEEELRKADDGFKASGADLFLQRKEIEQALEDGKAEHARLQAELVELAAGPLPFGLVGDLVLEIQKQDKNEQEAHQAAMVVSVLEKRDREVLSILGNESQKVGKAVAEFFEQDREARRQAMKTDIFLGLSKESRELLSGLGECLDEEKRKAQETIEESTQAQVRIEVAERKLKMVPAEETVAQHIAHRDELKGKMERVLVAVERVDKDLLQLAGALRFKEKERDRILCQDATLIYQKDEDARIAQYAKVARERIADFELRVLESKISYLESIILDCVGWLYRKKGFVCAIKIDPNDYELKLFGKRDEEIPIGVLSAGERQLLVIAILWGLGRASGRPLPVIIDTPLGRLDSVHRDNLLNYYFPAVSHQAVLLSTDTEIDKEAVEMLAPYVSKKYHLQHDDKNSKTRVIEGYFWSN